MTPYYDHGGIVIYHGDCREILPTLGKVDAVVTDPPYGNGFASQPTTGGRRRGQPKEMWDESPVAGLVEKIQQYDQAIIWGANHYAFPPKRGWLCWYKPDAPPSMGDCEFAWTTLNMPPQLFTCSIASTNPERLGHPTQKPLRLMRWCLTFIPDAKTILDPFMGSGTTLRAAKDMNRQAIGIELEEKYCEDAARRMEQEVFNFA